MKKIALNPIVLWLVLTGLYLLFGYTNIPDPITLLIGLFVPFGALTFLYGLMQNNYILLVPLFTLIILILYNQYLKKSLLKPLQVLALNLLLLLVITFLSDIIFFHSWKSLNLFLGKSSF